MRTAAVAALKRQETMTGQTSIEKTHRRDIMMAGAFVFGLWLATGCVAFGTLSLAPSTMARAVLLIGGATLLVFTTAAIMAMLRPDRKDRDVMSGLDIRFLDAAKATKKGKDNCQLYSTTQSKLGQIIDVIGLLTLTFGALYRPLWLGLAGREQTSARWQTRMGSLGPEPRDGCEMEPDRQSGCAFSG